MEKFWTQADGSELPPLTVQGLKKEWENCRKRFLKNWQNKVVQPYKDALNPIAAAERAQQESIAQTIAKQQSARISSDNRTTSQKVSDYQNRLKLEEQQRIQQNVDNTQQFIFDVSPLGAVTRLLSPNGVVKTIGNVNAAVENGGGHYIESAARSAVGDALDLLYVGSLGKNAVRSSSQLIDQSKNSLSKFQDRQFFITLRSPQMSTTNSELSSVSSVFSNRAKRLGISERRLKSEIQQYILNTEQIKALLKKHGYSDDVINRAIQRYSTRQYPLAVTNISPIGKPTAFIVNNKDMMMYTSGNPSTADAIHNIVNIHEFDHVNQFLRGDGGIEFSKQLSKEIGMPVRNIFISEAAAKEMDISKNVYHYLLDEADGYSETIARIGQIKDAFHLAPGENLTMQMLNAAESKYATSFLDNDITPLFKIIKDKKAFLQFANSPSVKKYVGVLTGAAMLNSADGELTSFDNINNQNATINYLNIF